MGLIGKVRRLRELFDRERKRSISVVGTRAYVEYRGILPERLDVFGSMLEQESKVFPNLTELGVEPLTRRVLFQFAGTVPDDVALSAMILRAEERTGRDARAEHERERVLPDDEQLDLQYSVEAIVEAASLVIGAWLRLLPFFPRRLGSNFYALAFLAKLVQAIRKPLEERYGKERTDLALSLVQ